MTMWESSAPRPAKAWASSANRSPVCVDLSALSSGSNEWENVQGILRRTFRELLEALASQGRQCEQLSLEVSELRADLARSKERVESFPSKISAEVAELRGEVLELKDKLAEFGGISSAVALSSALELKASQSQVDDLASRVSSLFSSQGAAELRTWRKLASKSEALEEQVRNLGSRLDTCEVTCSIMDAGSLLRKIERLQHDVSRKAEASAVEEALLGKANRTSVVSALNRKARKDCVSELEKSLRRELAHVREARQQQEATATRMMEDRIDGIAASLGEVEDATMSLRERVVHCEKAIDGGSGEHDGHEDEKGLLKSDLATCQSRIDSLGSRLSEIEQLVREKMHTNRDPSAATLAPPPQPPLSHSTYLTALADTPRAQKAKSAQDMELQMKQLKEMKESLRLKYMSLAVQK